MTENIFVASWLSARIKYTRILTSGFCGRSTAAEPIRWRARSIIKFDIASFFKISSPRYSFGASDSFPVLKFFPPFLRSELYDLLSEDIESKHLADSFNRFVMITFIAILLATLAVFFSVLAYYYFSYRGLFYPSFLLLVLCLISNFMAWYNLRRMGDSFEKFFNEKREKSTVFTHYEISDSGVSKKDIYSTRVKI